jgi:hypothetical protein
VSEKIESSIRARNVSDSSIIGVQVLHGLDEVGVQQFMSKELRPVLEKLQALSEALQRHPSVADEFNRDPTETTLSKAEKEQLSHPLPLASSLYVCRSYGSATIGYAVNNSGLVVCTSSIGPVVSVENVASREKHDVMAALTGSILQAVRFAGTSVAAVPAQLTSWVGDEQLFAFDAAGSRQMMRVTCFGLRLPGVKGFHPDEEVAFDDTIECERVGGDSRLIGGPVFTTNDEVCGMLLAQDDYGFQFFAPLANLDLDRMTTTRILTAEG